ncbi:MAG: glycoside hydrolase family 88 protein [Bdellovibrio sp.]|nr:glycoside hydrolase family 88 protein [Bdellovibrio sp.]
MKIYTFLFVAIFLPLSQTHAGVRLVSPKKDAYVFNNILQIVIKGCNKKPSTQIHFGDESTKNHWQSHQYSRQWISNVLLSESNYQVSNFRLMGKCGFHTIDLKSTFQKISDPLIPAEEVAIRYMSRHSARKEKWDWGPAIFLYGLGRMVNTSSRISSQSLQYLMDYHSYHMNRDDLKIDWADRCPSSLSAMDLAFKFERDFAMPNVEKVMAFLRHAKRNRAGSLDHFGNDTWMAKIFPSTIWVDSLMMWVLPAVKYALLKQDTNLLEFAVRQPLIFASRMQDKKSGFFFHAWNLEKSRSYPKNNTFWLRGNGWVLASFIEILELLGPGHSLYAGIKDSFLRLAYAMKSHQLPTGLWDTVVARPGYAYEELSGSALVAYAFTKAWRLGILDKDYLTRATRTFNSLSGRLKQKKNGYSMPGISWLTMPYPPIIYKMLPKVSDINYGVGAFLLLAAELALVI